MANSQTLSPLADPLEHAAGQILRASVYARKMGGLNHLLARAQTDAPIWSIRSANAGSPWASFAGAGPQTLTAAPFMVPALSDQHTGVTVVVDCAVSAGVNATITAKALTADNTVNEVVFPQARGKVAFTIATSPIGDRIRLQLSTDGTTIDIYGVEIRVDGLADPLPAADISSVEPMGIERAAEQLPCHAAMNRRMRDAVEHLRDRPRRLGCWMGLDPALGDAEMSPHIHAFPMIVESGVEQTATVHVYVDNSGGPAGVVPVVIGPDIPTAQSIQNIEIAVGLVGWASAEVAVPAYGAGEMPWETAWIGVWPGEGGGGHSSIPILAAYAEAP